MTLSLFPELESRKPARKKARGAAGLSLVTSFPRSVRRRHPALWLCLRFPDLIVEALSPASDHPCLVVEGEGSAACVAALNAPARAAGILSDMRLSSALALLASPRLLRREPDRERACLNRAADAALAFTDRVSLLPGEGLLLEVRGSLRLFGGLAPLRRLILRRIRALGHRPVWATAPTPLAAVWLSRGEPEAVVESLSELPARLGRLAPDCMALAPDVWRNLEGIGIRRMEDILRLPRAGLSRRWGPTLQANLDRALGSLPDPRPCWRGQLCFQAHHDLPMESSSRLQLVRVARHLLHGLVRFLRVHDSQVEWIECCLAHHRAEHTRIRLNLLGSVRDVDALAELFSIRMERVVLPESVLSLSVRSAPLKAQRIESRQLFREMPDGEGESLLLDRLCSRLGPERVFALASRAVHRPEASWQVCEPGREVAGYGRQDRPLWLLSEPRLLDSMDALTPLAGPERIETGWWEGRDIQRDYYRVRSRHGHEAWVFRDRRDRRWFLHGFFG